jgi:hypothetical protein
MARTDFHSQPAAGSVGGHPDPTEQLGRAPCRRSKFSGSAPVTMCGHVAWKPAPCPTAGSLGLPRRHADPPGNQSTHYPLVLTLNPNANPADKGCPLR